MEKNINLKIDPLYGKSHLRRKIDERVKRQRDATSEVKVVVVKVLHPKEHDTNRDTLNLIKRFRNKFSSD